MKFDIFNDDCTNVLKTLQENSITACITDPPYHLTQVSRKGSPRKINEDSPYGRHKLGSRGFMGKTWDGGDIAFRKEVWEEVLRVLKPGAYLMAFGGTRTFHRLACAIEDAGFEIKDCLSYVYGTGFPKSMDIGKMMEKHRRGNPQGKANPESPNHDKYLNENDRSNAPSRSTTEKGKSQTYKLKLSEESKKWQGYGTALKPAWEPIILAMKPLDSTYVDNAQIWGNAGLNIEDTRIQTTENLSGGAYSGGKRNPILGDSRSSKAAGIYGQDGRLRPDDYEQPSRRWPANFILSHHPDCDDKCKEDCPIKLLDEQTSNLKGGTTVGKNRDNSQVANNIYGKYFKDTKDIGYGDSGGASRFFYCAKASSKERNLGCEYLFWKKDKDNLVLISQEDWSNLPKEQKSQGNIHVTVKPLAIMKWLCSLIKNPNNNVILDPFMGSGSTGCAVLQSGCDFIGIDNDPTACAVAEARLKYYYDEQNK